MISWEILEHIVNLVFILFLCTALCVNFHFFAYVFFRKVMYHQKIILLCDILYTIVVPVLFFLYVYLGSDYFIIDFWHTPLAHDHAPVIIFFVAIAITALWISKIKLIDMTPLGSLLLPVAMCAGIFIAVLVSLQMGFLWSMVFSVPFIQIFLIEIINHHYQFLERFQTLATNSSGFKKSVAWLLTRSVWYKIPFFVLLAFPFLYVGSCMLQLLGQDPHALILAFTETCNWGLSQKMCTAGDPHYLCTVASRGHRKFVRPFRKGMRNGMVIEVNRQLLVANAFEDWLEDHFRRLHFVLRSLYNMVGLPLYKIITNKWIADFIYVMMKPFEWFFLCWLYLCDPYPESRIALQYLPPDIKKKYKSLYW